ncbi:MAG: galactitol-1-phosphate 5-dehydrogenase [Kiloniella sp.]|nr:galactitol-1-phosphate 5-dehydrogenase [Kiloniella sp.]
MKALVYTGPKQLDYREVPDPVAAEGEVLIDLDFSGICGSDLHAVRGHDPRRPAPMILGHEAAGVAQSGVYIGQRVTINPLVSCGRCAFCSSDRENLCTERQIISLPPRAGSFAERICMPEANLVTVPEGVALWQAALTEPMACGWHAVRLALEQVGEPAEQCVAVVLGGGAIGLSAALSLSIRGLSRITVIETNPARRDRMRKALPQFDFHAGFADTDQIFPDLVVDAVGIAPTRELASAIVRPGGVIAHIGLGDKEGGLDVRRMTLQEIGFIGTYTYTAQDFLDTAQAIFRGEFGTFDWVDQRPLSAGHEAVIDLLNGQVDAGKIVLMTA